MGKFGPVQEGEPDEFHLRSPANLLWTAASSGRRQPTQIQLKNALTRNDS